MKRPSPFRYLLLIIPVGLVILLAGVLRTQLARMAGVTTPVVPIVETEIDSTPLPPEELAAFQKSVDAAVEKLKQSDPGFSVYNPKVNNIELAEDGSTALVWLESYDPDSGELLAREPELAIAKSNPAGQKGTGDEWGITLPYDPAYETVIGKMPSGLMGKDLVQRYQEKYAQPKVTAKFGGYYLPWAGGVSKKLTWSIGHKSCSGSDCKYAFDFADGSMFPIQAAKGGSVFAAQWTCNNGSTKCTNYLILQDNSTTPVSYQLYYHLANGSIPAALRVKGARVNQGQYIGNVDDTGYSTANHLHFMVHTNSYGYWGASVDITFKDVDINYDPATKGGRPRMTYEASQYGGQGRNNYISGNRPANAPTGSITAPTPGQVFTSNNLVVSGVGKDDKGITKVQVIANYDNAWHEVGTPATSSNFSIPIDMCAEGKEMPDGPIILAVNLYDVEGNQSYGNVGFRGITKNFPCKSVPVQPPCVPAANQVAFFNQPNFTGTCKVFSAGDYSNRTSMGSFSGNDAASVLIGNNAQVTIWAKASYTNRSETLVSSDPDLKDNLINRGAFNSFKVKTLTTLAAAPSISYPTNGVNITSNDSVTLYWLNTGWADEFQAVISGNNGFVTRTSTWMQATSWSLGSLPAGSYSWNVKGRNTANNSISAFASATFTVKAAPAVIETPISVPYMDTIESGINNWKTTGLWKQTTTKSSSATHSWLYGETISSVLQYNTGIMGSLTSPTMRIPETGYFLHFTYRYKTESGEKYWDKRMIQISKDGGPFMDVYQLSDDPIDTWLLSPAIDLSAYAGSNIRIRFHFNTVDNTLNAGDGWYVDNIQVDRSGPAGGCNEPTPNNSISEAQSITVGAVVPGDICSAGDVDYYKFTAAAGQSLTMDIDAKSIGSALDSYLYLIDRNGRTVLAENDDEVAQEIKDSRVFYKIPADGTYFLKVKAWDNPMVGGNNYFYTLRIYSDPTVPTATIAYPGNSVKLPNGPVSIRVNASDNPGGSGISHVAIFWHNQDWNTGKWIKIGEDWNGTDGWNVIFDTSKEIYGTGGAIYAQVFDGSGNWTGTASFDLTTDPNQLPPPTPTSALLPLPAESDINTVLLQWNATEAGSGIAGFEFQVQENGGPWTDWIPVNGVKSADRSAWFIGIPGKNYGFRMRVVDGTGAKEEYPANAEAVIKLKECTAGIDSFEVDSIATTAKNLPTITDRQTRTFCGQNDEDWAKFSLQPGELFFFNALPLSPADAVVLTIYDAAGNPLAEQFPTQLGQPSTLRWIAPDSQTYYLKMRNFNPLIAGDGVGYQVWVDQGIRVYLPMVLP
jgi:murein DD-endopeptidase MepM/ murein hydrolase activator NlpD